MRRNNSDENESENKESENEKERERIDDDDETRQSDAVAALIHDIEKSYELTHSNHLSESQQLLFTNTKFINKPTPTTAEATSKESPFPKTSVFPCSLLRNFKKLFKKTKRFQKKVSSRKQPRLGS